MYDSIPSHRITINMGANTIPFDPMGTQKKISAPRTTLEFLLPVGTLGPRYKECIVEVWTFAVRTQGRPFFFFALLFLPFFLNSALHTTSK